MGCREGGGMGCNGFQDNGVRENMVESWKEKESEWKEEEEGMWINGCE